MSIMKLITKAKYINIVRRFCGNEPTRYYLSGIHFEPHPKKGVIMVATNGHYLGAIYDENGVFENGVKNEGFTLPVSNALKRTLKDCPDRLTFCYYNNLSAIISCDPADQKTPLVPGKQHVHLEYTDPIDGTFPDWRRVVPKGEFKPVHGLNFNPKYLSHFAFEKSHCVSIYQMDEVSPALVKVGGLPEFMGVLMPMRGSSDDKLPEWALK